MTDSAHEIAGKLSKAMRLWLLDRDRPQGLGQQRQVKMALIRRGLLDGRYAPPVITALGLSVRRILEAQDAP